MLLYMWASKNRNKNRVLQSWPLFAVAFRIFAVNIQKVNTVTCQLGIKHIQPSSKNFGVHSISGHQRNLCYIFHNLAYISINTSTYHIWISPIQYLKNQPHLRNMQHLLMGKLYSLISQPMEAADSISMGSHIYQ